MSEWPPFCGKEACLLPQGIWLWVEPTLADPPQGPAWPMASMPASLSPREEAHWQTLSHPRRRLEWKQGRLMAKQLLAKALSTRPEAFELLPREEGPPLVLQEGKALQGGRLSISHTAAYVGVAFAPFAVGLDICDEADAGRLARIAYRVFSAGEAALCQRCPQGLVAMWALKEAALKMQGGGIFQPGLSSIQVQALFPPALASPVAQASLYALPKALAALVFAP
ncbi:MAG: 4'-phosphopantetheinyl transferase superfamily protein [Cystobacterineae bacterium]|nr:4'-phosphopantetheinyl transferase superfamily protein [Cystobacterineae bacterium]